MSYLIFASFAAFCFALSQVISKAVSNHGVKTRDSLFVYFLLSTFVFGVFLLPFVSFSPPTAETLSLVGLTTITFLFGAYCFHTGIFEADATTFAPLFQLQAGIIAVLAYLFLGERFPVQNYLWMSLLLVGAVLVSVDEKSSLKSFFNRGVLFILAMQVFHSFSNLFVGLAIQEIHPVEIIFWEYILMGPVAALFIYLRKPQLRFPVKAVVPIFASTFIVGIGVISLFTAFAQNLTISSVIGMLSAPIVFLMTMLVSRFYPKLLEKHSGRVYAIRGLGLLIILTGAYFVAAGT